MICSRLPLQSRSTQASVNNTTMPHRVLEVDEILREITASVADIDPPTAVSLACCAKSFEQPALSALWKSQKELPTLIKTLPPDSWELQPTNPRGGGGKIVCGSLALHFDRGLNRRCAGFTCRRSLEYRQERNGPGSEDTRPG